jgi:MFS family permease
MAIMNIKGRNSSAGVITVAALVSIFTFSFIASLPQTIINEIIETFSLAGASEGLTSSMVSLGFMLSLVFVPLAQGRAQKLPMLIAACVFQAAMLIVCGVSPTFAMFCAMCVFLGFSGGFIDTCCNSAVVDAWGAESPKYVGYLHGLFGVGCLLMPLLIYLMLRHTDWRGIHYILAAVSLMTASAIFLLMRGQDKGDDGRRDHIHDNCT